MKTNQIQFNCDSCGKVASDSASHYRRKKRHFCNQKCYSEFRRDRLPKEEQHAYGTGHSIEERTLRRKARSDLNHAIRDGEIIRPRYCAHGLCNNIPEAHHDNYAKPFEVHWLCLKHHRQYHHENPELLKPSLTKGASE